MSSLSQPEPPPRPPILTSIYAATPADPAEGPLATLSRAPGATSAILRDAQGRMRARIDGEDIGLEAMRYIKSHPDQFVPEREETACPVDPQRP